MEIVIGAAGSAHLIVGEADTAIALGSGDVPVLGTPRIVALLEQAAVAALAGDLADGTTSVGTHIAVDHVAASFVGAAVEAIAEVVDVDGRTVTFRLSRSGGRPHGCHRQSHEARRRSRSIPRVSLAPPLDAAPRPTLTVRALHPAAEVFAGDPQRDEGNPDPDVDV